MEIRGPQGLGGWLIVVGIGVVLAPLLLLADLSYAYSKMFKEGMWEALTTPGSDAYHPLWQPILSAEFAINGFLVVAWAYAAFLFFSKKESFPMLFIGITLFQLFFMTADAFSINLVLLSEPVIDPRTTGQLLGAFGVAAIWMAYMLVSKRVKATFVVR